MGISKYNLIFYLFSWTSFCYSKHIRSLSKSSLIFVIIVKSTHETSIDIGEQAKPILKTIVGSFFAYILKRKL